jgi:hypothetical protein
MKRLLLKIREEADLCVTQVAIGSATDYADYQSRCGYIRALEHVRQWCKEIAEQDEENPNRPS